LIAGSPIDCPIKVRALLEMATNAAIMLGTMFLAALANAGPGADVPEPPGLWIGAMHGQTPNVLSGAVVVDLAGVAALLAEKPLLLDVGPAARKPENFPNDRPWLPIHRSIPNAVWMPGAGSAPLDAGREQLFYRRIEELTYGDKAKPIVVFCRPQCWGGWNAGKRLVSKGYTGVRWFPAGTDGWQEQRDTAAVEPDTEWIAELPQ
jgi:PQQ-dependent catabolism-associated CXXCW motif protein